METLNLRKNPFHHAIYCLLDNMFALVQIIAWRRTGGNSLSDPVTTPFTDTYVRNAASMSEALIAYRTMLVVL